MFIDIHTHKDYPVEGVFSPACFGIHPWHAHEETASTYDTFHERYASRFADAEIVGECGLDRVFDNDIERQQEVFEWQIKIAEEQNKPVVVHCVRALDRLLQMRKHHRKTPWVVHGFRGGTATVQQLNQQGIYASFGTAILDEKQAKTRQCLAETCFPFFLETDDTEVPIAAVYNAAAKLRKVPIEELEDAINVNYHTLLKNWTKQTN